MWYIVPCSFLFRIKSSMCLVAKCCLSILVVLIFCQRASTLKSKKVVRCKSLVFCFDLKFICASRRDVVFRRLFAFLLWKPPIPKQPSLKLKYGVKDNVMVHAKVLLEDIDLMVLYVPKAILLKLK